LGISSLLILIDLVITIEAGGVSQQPTGWLDCPEARAKQKLNMKCHLQGMGKKYLISE